MGAAFIEESSWQSGNPHRRDNLALSGRRPSRDRALSVPLQGGGCSPAEASAGEGAVQYTQRNGLLDDRARRHAGATVKQFDPFDVVCTRHEDPAAICEFGGSRGVEIHPVAIRQIDIANGRFGRHRGCHKALHRAAGVNHRPASRDLMASPQQIFPDFRPQVGVVLDKKDSHETPRAQRASNRRPASNQRVMLVKLCRRSEVKNSDSPISEYLDAISYEGE